MHVMHIMHIMNIMHCIMPIGQNQYIFVSLDEGGTPMAQQVTPPGIRPCHWLRTHGPLGILGQWGHQYKEKL